MNTTNVLLGILILAVIIVGGKINNNIVLSLKDIYDEISKIKNKIK